MALVVCKKCQKLISEQCDRCGFCGAIQNETGIPGPTEEHELILPEDEINFSHPDLKAKQDQDSP